MAEFIFYIIYILFGLGFIFSMADLKYPKKKIWICCIPVIAVLVAVAYYLFFVLGRHYFNVFYPLMLIASGALFITFVAKDKDFRGLFPFISAIFFVTLSDTIGNTIYVYALRTFADWRIYAAEILFMTAVLICVRKFIRPLYSSTSRYSKRGWLAMDIILMAYEFMLYMVSVTMEFDEIIFIRFGLEAITLVVFIYASVFSAKNMREQYLEYEKKLLDDQVRAGIMQAETFKEKERELSHIRHDIRAKLMQIKEITGGDGTDPICQIIREIDEELTKTKSQIFSSNAHVNAILTMYHRQAEMLGIDYEVLVDVPKDFKLDVVEFSVMISNLLRNAIDGCDGIEEGKKFIIMHGRTTRKAFILELKSSERKTASVDLQIESYLEKNNGWYDCMDDGDCSKIKILIDFM